jgi:purine-nucleoside phosphorylase
LEAEIGIVLGSGLGDLADEYCDSAVDYNKIPGFLSSTVAGHKGRLVFAEISGKKVVMMQGRSHFYEGHKMSKITYPIKYLKTLGVKTLILTNAAGAVNESFRPSDLMIITDHINFMGTNPLIGPVDGTERFPDMSGIYNAEFVQNCAKQAGIDVQSGVYMAFSGPSYETPAEVRMARTLGADAVGMSTVPEAIVASACGMDVLGISCISNAAAGVSSRKLSHEEVIETTNRAKQKFKKLILEIIKDVKIS